MSIKHDLLPTHVKFDKISRLLKFKKKCYKL